MTTFVLFGGTGDLAFRKILPALYSAYSNNRLAADFRLIGVARQSLSEDAFRERVTESITRSFPKLNRKTDTMLDAFLECVHYMKLDASVPGDYAALKQRIDQFASSAALFYMATAPDLFVPIVAQLKANDLIRDNTRVVVEKPLGRDGKSAREINQALRSHLKENQIYRIDHYLGKEMVQNLLVLRFANSFMEPLWNRKWIQEVQISISEQVGVEARGESYERTGALRDMVQNHLLQLLSIVAMEPPVNTAPNTIRDEKVKVLRALHPLTKSDVTKHVIRGQYRAGAVDGKPVVGYPDEAGIPPGSRNETFVALRAEIDNWRWAGVPFFLRTGKRMATRCAEIVINFKPVPFSIFGTSQHNMRSNRLVISLQPEESLKLHLTAKEQGEGITLSDVALNLDFATTSNSRRVEAYERLLLDAMRGDLTLFVRDDELMAAWDWVDPIIDSWESDRDVPRPYIAGSWGPTAASVLLAQSGSSWSEEYSGS
jgi:glucose-6-phosphate 1-dehydrogenase